jgi:catechol 2,3-dioxygenase-like lactoylglutathione lyase family enzyme/predicted enzyme related to lactoylglutathione lyase
MRTLMTGLWLAATVMTGTAGAQPVPFNELGVKIGHWHLNSRDVQANKKIFVAMGGTAEVGRETVNFPGFRVNLDLTESPPASGGSIGSVVNHVGFIVNNVQEQAAKWKAAGVPVLPGGNGRLDQAYVETPDGVRIEILEDKTQAVPIRHEHIHFFLPEAEIAKSQAWYAKIFGAKPGIRGTGAIADMPGGQLRFAKADKAQIPTKGRILDHYGFDVQDLVALIKRIEAEGIKLDEPYRKNATTGTALAYMIDPWGARIELVQRAPAQ